MPLVGFETTVPASERAKAVHALDRSATVTGTVNITVRNYINTSELTSGINS
jgi:hypothetical protein